MTIHLPRQLEHEIRVAVQSGQFASVDEAMTEAARLLLRDLGQRASSTPPLPPSPSAPDPILGLMRHDPELMDEIVADAYRQRQDAQWRELDL